ncbi:MAG: hypothetical protein JNK67_07445 [Alphaproteobacteria bacterium]|nr:hypothetical protein [Alphaproteobacteria bacterium]
MTQNRSAPPSPQSRDDRQPGAVDDRTSPRTPAIDAQRRKLQEKAPPPRDMRPGAGGDPSRPPGVHDEGHEPHDDVDPKHRPAPARK